MRQRGAVVVLWRRSRSCRPPAAATTSGARRRPAAPTATEAPPATSTGAAEEPAPATTTGPATGGETTDPAVIADAAARTAAAGSAKVATEVRVADPGRRADPLHGHRRLRLRAAERRDDPEAGRGRRARLRRRVEGDLREHLRLLSDAAGRSGRGRALDPARPGEHRRTRPASTSARSSRAARPTPRSTFSG